MAAVSQTSLRSCTLQDMLIKLNKSVNFKVANIENHSIHLTETFAVKKLEIVGSDVSLKQVLARILLIELTTIVNFSWLNVTKNLHFHGGSSFNQKQMGNISMQIAFGTHQNKTYIVCQAFYYFFCFLTNDDY